MKRTIVMAAAALILWGCSPAAVCSRGGIEHEGTCLRTENMLSESSRKVTVFFIKKDQAVPKDFDGQRFLHIVEEVLPDRFQVEALKSNFRVMARPLGRGFSVMLCTPDGNNKLFEDFNCTTEKVDIVSWDKKGPYPCEFEQHPERYCKAARNEK